MQNKTLLIIALVWPEPSSTAAGNRMLQLIHFFLEEDYQITVASTAAESERSMNLDALGITKATITLNHTSFDEFITDLNPEMVLFDRFLTEEQFGWRVAEFAPRALRILDTEDLHSLRKTREVCFKKDIPFTTDLWLQNDITKREIASIYRSDISLIISSYEMQLLNTKIEICESILLYLPFMMDPLSETEIKALKPFGERKDFICIGNGKHAPNVDAIVFLKTEIWPRIREQLSEAKLNIYGAYLPEYIQQMHKPSDGFLIHGWAADVKEVMENARINLAPLRFGAGLKGKLLDAMRYGTPSISTPVGAEGMHDGLEWSGTIAKQSTDFAKAAIALYQDETSWLQAQQKGTAIVNRLYDKVKHFEHFRQKINTVQKDLEKHRTQNFVGGMLQYQSMASTKYLSKWIEAKNKS